MVKEACGTESPRTPAKEKNSAQGSLGQITGVPAGLPQEAGFYLTVKEEPEALPTHEHGHALHGAARDTQAGHRATWPSPLSPASLLPRSLLCHGDEGASASVPCSGANTPKVVQSCPTLCDPMDCNPPGSSAHGILQARILEWVATSFSGRSSRPRDRTSVHSIGRWVLYH